MHDTCICKLMLICIKGIMDGWQGMQQLSPHIYMIIWFRLSVCMYVPVQDGGQGGRVVTSSRPHFHLGLDIRRCCRR